MPLIPNGLNRPSSSNINVSYAKTEALLTGLKWTIILCAVALATCPLTSLQFDRAMSCSGVIMITSLAALFSGALIGFIFGIPKIHTSAPTGLLASELTHEPNTNLEQISDWLTKIIIGVGLSQLMYVPKALQGMGEYIYNASNRAVAPATGSATIVFFVTSGFLYTYLITKLYLSNAIKESDNYMAAAYSSISNQIEFLNNDIALDKELERQVLDKVRQGGKDNGKAD